jgi:hypothetical protein
MPIPSSKTFYSCRVMRPDFRVDVIRGVVVASWTERGCAVARFRRGTTTEDRRELIEECHDVIAQQERSAA